MKKTQFVQKNTHPNYVFFKKIPRENWGQRAIQNHFRDQPRQGVPANMALTLPKTDPNPNRPGGRAAIFSPSPQVIAFTRDFLRSPLSPMCPRTSPRRSILGDETGRK